MFKKIGIAIMLSSITVAAFAGSWVRVRGATVEAAFYQAQVRYGTKFVQRGSCTTRQTDGYYYCDALIDN